MNHLCDTIQLVEGTYCPADSADVLLSLIADKIKFHSLQKLLLKDENDLRFIHAERRIEELKESKRSVTKSILKARNEGYFMKIDGMITIELVKQVKSYEKTSET